MDDRWFWNCWQEHIIESGAFMPPQVWFCNLAPKPYVYVSYSRGGCFVSPIPSPFGSVLDYGYKTIRVWVN